MIKFVFHTDPAPASSSSQVHVMLYEQPAAAGISTPRVGGPALTDIRRLGTRVSVASFDFLTIALAVTAADTFALRSDQAVGGWERDIALDVPLAEPERFQSVREQIEAALGFLTGDRWRLSFRRQGIHPPAGMGGRGQVINRNGADQICLFSGGLDSTIGVLDQVHQGRRPLLISHAYRGDKAKQRTIQQHAFHALPRLEMIAHPVWRGRNDATNDVTMRSRSLGFLAMAAVAASTLAASPENPIELIVPENGFIAINAPLTSRRFGSLSTRTTHPQFLGAVQALFDALEFGIAIRNPYEFLTKGEMLVLARSFGLTDAVAVETVSCGKWKRKLQQCGRCIPCLVRRAAFFAAKVEDNTPYRCDDLGSILKNENDAGDLLAVASATGWSDLTLQRRVAASGLLPVDAAIRAKYIDVVKRGLGEIRSHLSANGVPI